VPSTGQRINWRAAVETKQSKMKVHQLDHQVVVTLLVHWVVPVLITDIVPGNRVKGVSIQNLR